MSDNFNEFIIITSNDSSIDSPEERESFSLISKFFFESLTVIFNFFSLILFSLAKSDFVFNNKSIDGFILSPSSSNI